MSQPFERPQVGDPVDAAGIALAADDQDRQDSRQGLGDNREIDAADPTLEHRHADHEGKRGRHHDDRDQVRVRLWNGCQNSGSDVI